MMIDAILVVSFGTSHENAHQLAIEPVVSLIQSEYPKVPIAQAYSSSIIRRVLARKGQEILSPAEALGQLATKGYRHVALVPTHLIPGEEHAKVLRDVDIMRSHFAQIHCAAPLMDSHEDMLSVVAALALAYPLLDRQALVLMGHGSPTSSNAIYAALDYTFKQQGHHNIFVGANGAYPDIQEVISLLHHQSYKEIILAPLLLVAGEHAKEDMAGEHPQSWMQQLYAAGYHVDARLQGLGEIPSIQKMYLQHLKHALEGATKHKHAPHHA